VILHVHQLSQSHGLTQDVAKQTAEQRARAGYVPYLVPKQFDLSVTKGDGDYSNGVINYCILTHRHNGMAELEIDLKTDPCAGFWQAGDTPFRRPRGWHVEWRRRRHVHFSRCFPRLVAERGVFFVFQGQHDRACKDAGPLGRQRGEGTRSLEKQRHDHRQREQQAHPEARLCVSRHSMPRNECPAHDRSGTAEHLHEASFAGFGISSTAGVDIQPKAAGSWGGIHCILYIT